MENSEKSWSFLCLWGQAVLCFAFFNLCLSTSTSSFHTRDSPCSCFEIIADWEFMDMQVWTNNPWVYICYWLLCNLVFFCSYLFNEEHMRDEFTEVIFGSNGLLYSIRKAHTLSSVSHLKAISRLLRLLLLLCPIWTCCSLTHGYCVISYGALFTSLSVYFKTH